MCNNTNKTCFDVECPNCLAMQKAAKTNCYICSSCSTVFAWDGYESQELSYNKTLQLNCMQMLQLVDNLANAECTCAPNQLLGKPECLRCVAARELDSLACNARTVVRGILERAQLLNDKYKNENKQRDLEK